ncbi:MAG: T9SS type A sorting domain-containing protein [Flavobacterium sp.]|nr:MAG: T9SS type A sorting domain-containing protein [Flavobacterium sp.]
MTKTTLSLLLAFSTAAFAQNAEMNLTGKKLAPMGVSRDINSVSSISATISYQGYEDTQPFLGQAEYEIFPDNVNGIIDKPIILLDGFDPNDGRNIPAIYGLLDYGTGQNLADDLRNQGYDVFILNFPNYTRAADNALISGGSDYIQRNAMVLVELINQINAMKVGTEKNIVIGPSMGGLIARYGLRYMETHSLDHDTWLYISFDAPHKGANIPIGYQHLFNYMAYGPLGDATVQVLVDAMLKSNASREMLMDQYEGHLQSGSAFEFDPAIVLPTGKTNFRTAFQAELDAMGFPQNARNIAIANGASNGSMNGTPGMTVMDHTFNITSTQRAIINLGFTPLANQTLQVSRFRGQVNIFVWITAYESAANSKSFSYTDGLDSAPGGKFDISSLQDQVGSNALLTEFFSNLNINYFDFVPTNSSLAISGTQNLYSPVTDVAATGFDAYYAPIANENHVTLTPANMAFVLNEILNPALAVAQQTFSGLQVENPVGNSLNIFSAQPILNADLKIVDTTGKIVYSQNSLSIEGNVTIPVSLNIGMYFLSLQNPDGKIVKKIVKN